MNSTMLADHQTSALLAALERPDLAVIARNRQVSLEPALDLPFRLDSALNIAIGGAVGAASARRQAFTLRHALELAALLSDADERLTQRTMIRASFAAARVAALFLRLDASEAGERPRSHASDAWSGWLAPLVEDTPPDEPVLASIWRSLRSFLSHDLTTTSQAPGHLTAAAVTDLHLWLQRSWPLIGPAETLMAAGGDARLQLDPQTGLNHYGCSHRPRPWAVTFASSTASSVSERGFAGAETARLNLQRALLHDRADAALSDLAIWTRAYLASYYDLPDGADVILSPSGTDCELAALAIAMRASDHKPVTNILIAPEETGSGVPLAAAGRHFALDTAQGVAVEKGEPVPGFASTITPPEEPAVEVLTIALRDADGACIPTEQVAERCERLTREAVARGRRVLLHQLDLSKTGLKAPDEATLDRLSRTFGDLFDVVVDACQARLMPERIGSWVAAGRAVMITGSKFMTGPPFCGALLLPKQWRARLEGLPLPEGLGSYASHIEWPDCAAASSLSKHANHGLLLRWSAAIAEMAAFKAVPAAEARRRLALFLDAAHAAIEESEDVRLVPPPALERPRIPDQWDDLATILCFQVKAPDQPDAGDASTSFRPLDVADARRVYHWLNADLSPAFAPDEAERRSGLAARQCHIGQPVATPDAALGGAPAGALRLSAGARLVSGEPSHEGLGVDRRMAREIADARTVIAKIGLIRRHWSRIAAANPSPGYAPAQRAVTFP
ncbi:hypothetical protein [Acetobacter nitrogenifigens]|nr:hypothetical protein [Acetobacter nitrogenifigens]